MNSVYIISQIINGLGTIFNIIAVNMDKKSKTLIFFVLANVCVTIALGLLNATSGMIVQIFFVIETIINYFWEKKNSSYPIWLIIIYILMPTIVLSLNFESVWDILPLCAGIFFPLALIARNFTLRFFNLLTVIVWIPYSIHFGQYVGAISCIILTIMNIIAIIRLDILKKSDTK